MTLLTQMTLDEMKRQDGETLPRAGKNVGCYYALSADLARETRQRRETLLRTKKEKVGKFEVTMSYV